MYRRNKKPLGLCLILLAMTAITLIASVADAQENFRLIVHPEVGVDSLTKAEVSSYFLKKNTEWNDGTIVQPVDLNLAQVRDSFSSAVHRRKSNAIKKYWQRQIFTGRGTPPPEKDSDRQVIDFVRRTPGAIGYVSVNTNLSSAGVKVIELR